MLKNPITGQKVSSDGLRTLAVAGAAVTGAMFVFYAVKSRSREDEGTGGFSLKDLAQESKEQASEAAHQTPAEVLSSLQRGNARYCMGQMMHYHQENIYYRRRLLEKQQFPTVAVLGCATSRAPVEIIFDQGLGDIFVVRVAGNVLGTSAHASLQYAINHLKVKVVIIMGHDNCGALKAAQSDEIAEEFRATEIGAMLKSIKADLDIQRLKHINDPKARDREAVVTQVLAQVHKLTLDEGVRSKIRAGDLVVAGAFYELASGIVDFFGVTDSKTF